MSTTDQGHPHSPVPGSKAGRARLALGAGIVALIVVLVFIVENSKAVSVTFFGASWKIPLAVDLLLAAVLGGLVALLLGTVRIFQLRRLARHRVPAGRQDAGVTGPTADGQPPLN